MPRPTRVDWRDRFGWKWITQARDQAECSSCWIFAAAALIESMARIEHCVWCVRSEGDIRRGMDNLQPVFPVQNPASHRTGDPTCSQAGESYQVLDWVIANQHGVADPDCYPWSTSEMPWSPTPDRSARTATISEYHSLSDIEQQKTWLDAVGPLIAHFDVYDDFNYRSYHDTSPYIPSVSSIQRAQQNVPPGPGLHYFLVVGYDDDQRCWIIKNSWSTNWGDNGFARIAYGQCNIDNVPKIGIAHVHVDPWTKRRLHSGNILESGYGATGRNFEIVYPAGSQIQHLYRDNAAERIPWRLTATFGNDAAACPTITQTTFNRNFEIVYLTTGRRLHHWYFDQTSRQWRDGGIFGPLDTVGVAGFIQSNHGAPGNLEVVVMTADGKLNHWWREHNWHDGGRFGSNVSYSGASLLQSTYGNLEVVCVLNSRQMQHWSRNDSHGNFLWNEGSRFGSNISSTPSMIEGQYGMTSENRHGNFELCVAVDGRVQHWWCNNQGRGEWTMSATFGHDVLAVAGLLESSYGFNLEVIVLTTHGQIQHYWRDRTGWREGVIIGG